MLLLQLVQSIHFLPGQKLQNVKAAIQDLNDKTCIALRKKTSSDKGYININAQKSGCFSTIGYTRREQVGHLIKKLFWNDDHDHSVKF